MKKTFLSSLLVVFTLTNVNSQQREFILPQWKTIKDMAWRDSVYLFTKFREGALVFDTGFESPQKFVLNYNMFFERMDEVLPNGDTTAFGSPPRHHVVRTAGNEFHFFPSKGYLRILQEGTVAVATRDFFSAGYFIGNHSGYSSETGRTPNPIDDNTQPFNLDRSYILRSELYLIAGNEVLQARKPNLLKLYEKDKGAVEYYLDKHEVMYTNVDSLTRVIRFLNELSGKPDTKIKGTFRVEAGERVAEHLLFP